MKPEKNEVKIKIQGSEQNDNHTELPAVEHRK